MRILAITGKDGLDFLHRVTAGSVRGVGVGEGRPGLLLNGQSRMIAQFDLLRVAEHTFWLACPEACFPALEAELDRLHFAEAFDRCALPFGASVRSLAGASRAAGGSFPLSGEGNELRWASAVPGYECFVGAAEPPAAWEFDRIGALFPEPGRDWDANTPALEAGTLPWIDRDKGCYPGQEVVERSLNVGHPARVLVAVEGELALRPGEAVPVDGAEGRVTSAATRGAITRALVRVPWKARNAAPAGMRVVASHWPSGGERA